MVTQQYSLLFPFSEVNYAVFQNAGIHALKKHKKCEVKIYTPHEFAGCYFHANYVEPLEELPYVNYSEISNYHFPEFSKRRIKTWVNPQIPNYLLQVFQQSLPAHLFHKLPAGIKADYKMKRYLYKSGIYKEVKRKERHNKSCFLGTSIYFDLNKFEEYKCDNSEAMQRNFENLNQMIEDNAILREEQILNWGTEFNTNPTANFEDLYSLEKATSFILENRNVAYVRTRTISGVAQVHNTNIDLHRLMVETLLEKDFAVLSLGTPAIELGIEHPRYLEISHSLSIKSQFYLAAKCAIRVMSAEAGLFVAWAATELPLILIGREWSETNLSQPISLITTRHRIGIKDLILKADFTKKDLLELLD
jgi:hypothetical protein